MNNIKDYWNELSKNFSNELNDQKRFIDNLTEKNDNMRRALFQIRNTLEKVLKNPQNINQAVYDCIDIARTVTPQSKNFGERFSIDTPLTDEEKTL
jgi:hypothetical protein